MPKAVPANIRAVTGFMVAKASRARVAARQFDALSLPDAAVIFVPAVSPRPAHVGIANLILKF